MFRDRFFLWFLRFSMEIFGCLVVIYGCFVVIYQCYDSYLEWSQVFWRCLSSQPEWCFWKNAIIPVYDVGYQHTCRYWVPMRKRIERRAFHCNCCFFFRTRARMPRYTCLSWLQCLWYCWFQVGRWYCGRNLVTGDVIVMQASEWWRWRRF